MINPPYPAPQPPYMSAPPNPNAGRGLKKAGKIVLVVGAVIFVVTVLVGVIMGVQGIGKATSVADDAQEFEGTTEVSAQAGEVYQLYAISESEEPAPMCEVIGADGSTPSAGTTQNSSFSAKGYSWESFDSFTAESAQSYTITCDSNTLLVVAPPVSMGGVFAGVGGILLAVFGGIFGIVVLIVGLVLYLVGRNRAAKARV